jgi:tetratricopeptide (TPR) repeat protein
MARRRLNTKVFAIIMGVVVVGGGTMFALARFRGAKADPKVLEERGDAAVARGDFREAYDDYAGAVGGNPKSPSLRLKLGDVCVKRTREEPNFIAAAHQQWAEAVAMDPTYKPALERLITSWWERVEFGADGGGGGLADVYAEIRSRADKLHALDPSDTRALVWRHVATVRQWLAAKSVPQEEVDGAIEGLREQARLDPSNPDSSYWLARAKVQIGQDLAAEKRPAEAVVAFADAADVMDKAVAANQQANAPLLFRAHQVRLMLLRVDPKAEERGHKAKAGELIAAAAKAAEAAPAAVKNYDEILIQWSDWLAADNKFPEARKVREALYAKYPNNQRVRLVWARTLAVDKAERPQAIEIMSKDIALPADVVGAGVWIHREYQAQTLNELIMLRLNDAFQEQDPEKKKQQLAALDEPLDKLKRLANPKAPKVLGLEGQILLAKDRPVEAVQVMGEAYRQFRSGAKDYPLMFVMARTYAFKTNQPGSARQLCEEIVRDNPNTFLDARALLADLLMRENKAALAAQHVAAIRRINPEYPDLRRLDSMALLLQSSDPKRAADIGRNLPESTNAERMSKLEFFRVANMPDEQIRLLNDILTADPKEVRAVLMLTQLYKARDLPDRAKEVVARSLVANPQDPTLQVLQQELGGVSAADLREQLRGRLKETFASDPFQYQLKLYDLERLQGGDPEASMAALTEALKLKPNDRTVLDMMFKELLFRRRFDEAKPLLDQLVALNPDQVGGRLYRHKYAMAREDYDQAERIGVELVEQYNEFAQSWLALAQAQRRLAKWPEAVRSYTEVLARQPTNYEALKELVDTYYYAGQTEEAEAKLKEMRGLFNSDTVVRELYLNHLANFGKPEAAIPEREELLKKNPRDAWSYLSLAATYFKNAQRLASVNKPDESKTNIQKAFETLSQGREMLPDETRFYAQVAEIRQYNGQLEQAEQVLKAYADRELAKVPPAKVRPDPWLALADFYSRAAKPEQAVAALSEALVRSDNDIDVRLRLVGAMVQAKQFPEAVRTLDAVRDSGDPRVARQRLEILIAQGSQQPGALPAAEREVRAALAKRDGADLRNLLASVLIDTGRADEAVGELNKSLALDPTNDASKYLRALAYARKAPPDSAAAIAELVELKKASQRNSAQTRLLLADLYDKTGKRKQAIQELADALTKTPGSRELRLALVRLYRAERPPQFGAALELLTQAENDPVLRTDPSWPREAALVYADQRRYEAAVIKMDQAVKLAPGNQDYRRELIELQLKFNGFGGALVQTDQLLRDGIDTWWLRAQRGVATGRQVTKDMLVRADTDPAVKAQVADLQNKAVEEFDQAVKLAGAGAGSEAEKAERVVTVLRRMGETVGYDRPLARLTPRLANDPTGQWRLLAVSFKRAKGDFAGAAADAERMLSEPDNAPDKPARRGIILRALADIYQTQSPPDYVKARDRYVELLKISDADLISLNNLAYIVAENLPSPDPQAAKDYSLQAFEMTRKTNDPNPMILDTHGWVLVLCGGSDLRNGLQILQGVVAQAPTMIDSRYHLGEAYLRQSPTAPADAEKQLAEAMRLIEEEEKLGGTVDAKLRDRVQTALGRAREALNAK